MLALLGAHHILHVSRIRVNFFPVLSCNKPGCVLLSYLIDRSYVFFNEANQLHTTSYYAYFNFFTCFGQLCANHQENLLYLCDTGTFHSVWVAVWSGNSVPIIRRTYCIYATPVFFTLYGQRQPPIQSEKYRCRIDTVSPPDDGHVVDRNM